MTELRIQLLGVQVAGAGLDEGGGARHFGLSCDDVDGAANSPVTIEYGAAVAGNLDTLDALQGDDTKVHIGKVHIIQTATIKQDQRVLCGGGAKTADIHRGTGGVVAVQTACQYTGLPSQ